MKPPPDTTGYQEQRLKTVLRMRRDGALYREIAKTVGVSDQTVANWCQKASKQGMTIHSHCPSGVAETHRIPALTSPNAKKAPLEYNPRRSPEPTRKAAPHEDR